MFKLKTHSLAVAWHKHLLLLLVAACALGQGVVTAQTPTKCLEIDRVLVDACNTGCPNSQEGESEMFRFLVGPAPIALNDLNAQWATPNGFLGWVQNAATASVTAQFNASITNCGWLIEPSNGLIPAGKTVLGITSTNPCITGNSFAGLSDTLYVIYQNAGNTFGHFKNTNNGSAITPSPSSAQSLRTFILTVVSQQCSDTVIYNIAALVNQFGTYGGSFTDNDGSSVLVNWPGFPDVGYVNDGCQAPFTPSIVQILTNPAPLPCGGTLALSAFTTGNVASVFWTGGTGSFTTPNSSTSQYTLGANETTGASISFCAVSVCGDTLCDVLQLEVEGATSVTITSNDGTTICAGSSVELTATGGANYLWSTGATTPSITVGSAGPVSVESTNACGTVSAEIVLDVINGPVAGLAGPAESCPGEEFTLIATGGNSFTWNTGADADTLTLNEPGTYTVIASNSCGTDQAEITVAQAATVVPSFAVDVNTGCEPHCVTLSATSDPTFSYTWSLGDGTEMAGNVVQHCYSEGLFDVTLRATPAAGDTRCAGDSIQIGMVQALASPIAAFTMDPLVVPLDRPEVTFTQQSSNADSVLWQFGTPQSFTSTAAVLIYAFDAYGCFPIHLRATNSNGCTDSTEQELCVEDAFALWAPNAFTPNNDGINDEFRIICSVKDPREFELAVFDRWGKQQFMSTVVGDGWKAEQVDDGLYNWIVRLRDTTGKVQNLGGHVIVVR